MSQEETLIDKALNILENGAKKIIFKYNGMEVTAYWVGNIIRIDVKVGG